MLRRFFCKTALVAIIASAVLAVSGVLWAQGRSEQALERVIEIQERNTARLMEINGVIGTAVGLNPGGRLAVLVLLERQEVGGIPQRLEGVPVHRIVTGEMQALPKGGNGKGGKPDSGDPVDPTARFERPVPIGVSTGHPDITAGTIGCRVIGTIEGETAHFALSNNHVYAHENLAAIGDEVIQPGTFDGGSLHDDYIGNLADFEPIKFDGSDNEIDAAIAVTTTALLGNATPPDGYGTPKSGTAAAYINQRVQKYGRTTRLTKGQVWGINLAVDVGYDSGIAHFVNQILVVNMGGGFILGGDSGSLLVSDGKGRSKLEPVGLLFAGDITGMYGIANPIDLVLDRFGVTIDGK